MGEIVQKPLPDNAPRLTASLSRLSMLWKHNGIGHKAAEFQAAPQFGLAMTEIVKASLMAF